MCTSYLSVKSFFSIVRPKQTEIAVPLVLGTMAAGLEYVGFKGIGKYIANDIKEKNGEIDFDKLVDPASVDRQRDIQTDRQTDSQTDRRWALRL